MPRICIETRRVIHLWNQGYLLKDIQKRLREEDIHISDSALYRLIKKERQYGSISDRPRECVRKKLNSEQVQYIDECMKENDECTARQLHMLLLNKWPGLEVSVDTIKRERRLLGWVASKPKYCQWVRGGNMEKRLEWCTQMISTNESFDNVIFTDECSIQLDSHGRLCFRLRGEPRKLKPKPKHQVKVHVWAGISKKKRGNQNMYIYWYNESRKLL